MMKTSKRGRNDLIHSEGLRLKAYKDVKGIWTIGVGHAATSGRAPIPKAGMVITKEEADNILQSDLEFFERRVRKHLGDDLPQHVFDGAVSFDFNTGGIHRASWVQAFKEGDMKDAERRFMMWRKPAAIIGRRKRERDLIFYGKYYTKEVEDVQEIVEETHRMEDSHLRGLSIFNAIVAFLVRVFSHRR